MHTTPLFTITNCNNGFIVEVHNYGVPVKMIGREEIKMVRDLMNGDNLIQELKDQAEEAPKLHEIKQNNVHVFKTWKEVLAFLKYIME